jgi:ribosomal protein S18 acetylase RimI-like enzyme
MIAVSTQSPTVVRRPATEDDATVLRALFEQSRDDLLLLPPALIDLQYRAQARQIAQDHPDATREVLVADGADAGLLVLAAADDAVWVVDIVVAPSHRRRRVAETVVRDVIDEASPRPVRLSVWASNAPARALYERLGFHTLTDSATHVRMERPAGPINRTQVGGA